MRDFSLEILTGPRGKDILTLTFKDLQWKSKFTTHYLRKSPGDKACHTLASNKLFRGSLKSMRTTADIKEKDRK